MNSIFNSHATEHTKNNQSLHLSSEEVLLEAKSTETRIFKASFEFSQPQVAENKNLNAYKISVSNAAELSIAECFLASLTEMIQTLREQTKDSKDSLIRNFLEKNLELFKKNPYLIDVSPSTGDIKGLSSLLLASRRGFFDLVKDMLGIYPTANINASPAEGPNKGKTPLWHAAAWRQWEIVREILNSFPNADINASPAEGPYNGETPLWYAVTWRQWELAREMIKSFPNADINASPAEGPDKGKTPLWYAANSRQWELVLEMIKSFPNADINASTAEDPNKGMTPLWYATIAQQWELAREMIKSFPNADINASPAEDPGKGKTPLWYAAKEQQWELVLEMIKSFPNADINASPVEGLHKGMTPFWFAAYCRQWELVREILRNYPEVYIDVLKSPDSVPTPYDLAAQAKQSDIIQQMKKLLAAQKRNRPGAIIHDRKIVDKVRFEPIGKKNTLYKHIGISVPISKTEVSTRLLDAVKSNKIKEVKKIFCAQELQTTEVLQALSMAIEQSSYEIAVYLFERIQKSQMLDVKCVIFECYRLAKIYRHEQFITYLQQQKEPGLPNLICCELYKAMCNKDLSVIVNFILEYTDLLDITNYQRLLIAATRSGCLFIVQFLLHVYSKDLSALTKILDEEGQTLLHLAVSYGQSAIAQTLVEACPDLLKVKNIENRTAIVVAVQAKKLELAKTLVEMASKESMSRTLLASSQKAKKVSLNDFLGFMEKGDLPSVIAYHKPFVKSIDAKTLFKSTIKSGALNIIAYFLNNLTLTIREYAEGVHIAAEHGKLDILAYFVKCLPSMQQEMLQLKLAGKTSLHVAAKSGNLDVIKYLLSIAPDLYAEVDDQNCTAEELAFRYKKLEIYNYLKSCAARSNNRPKDTLEELSANFMPLQPVQELIQIAAEAININEEGEKPVDAFNLPNESNEGYLEQKDLPKLSEAPLETPRKVEKILRKTLERRPSTLSMQADTLKTEEVKFQENLPSLKILEIPKLERVSSRSRKTLETRPTGLQERASLRSRKVAAAVKTNDQVASNQTDKRKGILEKKSSETDVTRPLLTRTLSQPLLNAAEDTGFLSAKKAKLQKVALSKMKSLWHGEKKLKPYSSTKSLSAACDDALSERSQESCSAISSEMSDSSMSQSQGAYTTCGKLIKFLSKCNVETISNIKLELSLIKLTLISLQKQNIIEFRLMNNTLSATKSNNPAVHLTAHTHNDHRAWYQKPEFTRDFLNFVCDCDSEVNLQVKSLGFL